MAKPARDNDQQNLMQTTKQHFVMWICAGAGVSFSRNVLAFRYDATATTQHSHLPLIYICKGARENRIKNTKRANDATVNSNARTTK